MAEGVQFAWDDANRRYIARHGITPEEAEEAYLSDTLFVKTQLTGGELRTTQLGQTRGDKVMFIVTTPRTGLVRIVTAWKANRKWRLLWNERMSRMKFSN